MSNPNFEKLATELTASLIENLVTKLIVSLNEVVLDENVIQDSTGQCLDFLDLAKLSQDEINNIFRNLLFNYLQEGQVKYTARYGEPSGIIADFIKSLNQGTFRINLNVDDEKMEVAVDCLNSQHSAL